VEQSRSHFAIITQLLAVLFVLLNLGKVNYLKNVTVFYFPK